MVWLILGAIFLFVFGSILGLRVSPREKLLGELRENARKIGLHPRLVPAPDWTKIPKASETRASMVAYYSLLIPEGKFALMQAIVDEQKQLNVVMGNSAFTGMHVPLNGVYAVDMQANCIGVYWDETADFRGEQLEQMKAFLEQLAQS